MRSTTALRQLLKNEGIVLAPGVYDGLSARLVRGAGFAAAYATGGGIARSMGYPDLGLLSMREVTDRLALISIAVEGLDAAIERARTQPPARTSSSWKRR
jgi:2-methylisocitrate lyase-like PEP mutase family enzyme